MTANRHETILIRYELRITMKIISMAKHRYKKQRVVKIALVMALCLSLFSGGITAATGCTASCCVGNSMDRHGHRIVQITDDAPCPCCSTSVDCAVDKNVSPVTHAAIFHDGERSINPPFSGGSKIIEAPQKTTQALAFPITDPPTKIPIYIATLNLIR